jgi:hypothetical protein
MDCTGPNVPGIEKERDAIEQLDIDRIAALMAGWCR